MKPIAKKEFSFNGIFYEAGDEVNINNKEDLIKLNEKGFINPLTQKEIQNFGKTTEIKKTFKKGDDNKWD